MEDTWKQHTKSVHYTGLPCNIYVNKKTIFSDCRVKYISIIVPMLDSVANNKRIFLGLINVVRLYLCHNPSAESCVPWDLLVVLYVGDVIGSTSLVVVLHGINDPINSVSEPFAVCLEPFPESSAGPSAVFLSPRKEHFRENTIAHFGLPTGSAVTIAEKLDFVASMSIAVLGLEVSSPFFNGLRSLRMQFNGILLIAWSLCNSARGDDKLKTVVRFSESDLDIPWPDKLDRFGNSSEANGNRAFLSNIAI